MNVGERPTNELAEARSGFGRSPRQAARAPHAVVPQNASQPTGRTARGDACTRRAARAFAPAIVGLAVYATAHNARADDTSECIAASEAGQSLRDQHALVEARDKLAMCGREVCPAPVRVDCIQLRAQVEAAIPSLVLRARDARGEDASQVKVFCDGAPFATQLDGKSLAVDPGPHTFRFEAAGLPPVERRIVVGEGEKNRLIVTEMAPLARANAPARLSFPAAATRERGARAGLLVPGVVVGGIGVAAVVPMSIFWVSGTHDIAQMRTTCAPSAGGSGCPANRVDSDRTKLIVGDAFMGIAVAGIATGAVLLLLHSARPDQEATASLRIEASPVRGGAFLSAGGDL
jgi:hypothetical protein